MRHFLMKSLSVGLALALFFAQAAQAHGGGGSGGGSGGSGDGTYACGDNNTCNVALIWINGPLFTCGGLPCAIANDLLDMARVDNEAELLPALRGLAPNIAPIVSTQAVEINRQLFNLVESRLSHTKGYRDIKGRAHARNAPKNDTALWMNAAYGESEYESPANPYDAENKSLIIGFDKHINRALRLGMGYAYTQSDINAFARTIDADTHSVIGYAAYEPSAFFWNTILTYSHSSYDETKHVRWWDLKADYDVSVLGVQTKLGYNLGFAYLGSSQNQNGRRVRRGLYTGDLIPEMGLRYFNINQGGYTDDAEQRMRRSNTNILTGLVGVKYDVEYPLENHSSFRAEAGIAGTYDFMQPDTDSTVDVANGATYRLVGETQERVGLEAGALVRLNIARAFELSLRYSGLFKSDYTNHAGTLGMRYSF